MKVGIWIEEDLDPNIGGGYSYTNKLIYLIDKKEFENVDIVFITKSSIKYKFKKRIIKLVDNKTFKFSLITRLIYFILNKHYAFRKILNQIDEKKAHNSNKHYLRQLKDNKVDLIYYLSQNVKYIDDFPFISTNWDLGHLSMYSFPEIMGKQKLEVRQNWYSNEIFEALAIFVESNSGRDELLKYLKVNPNKIKVLPIFPGNVVDLDLDLDFEKSILTKYGIEKQNFLFYPAQFWAHKNHYNLIKAFKLFLSSFPDTKLIFTGSDKGNLPYIIRCIEEEGLLDNVLYFGFVDLDELNVFYKNAIALVMPTFLGPTNMPLLEARDLCCPVICSDFDGHREQLGDGALYFDPTNFEDIHYCLMEIMKSNIRKQLLENSKIEYEKTIFREDKALLALEENLNSISKVRNCWGND